MTGRLAWNWSHPESHMTCSTPIFCGHLMKSGSLSLLITRQAQPRDAVLYTSQTCITNLKPKQLLYSVARYSLIYLRQQNTLRNELALNLLSKY